MFRHPVFQSGERPLHRLQSPVSTSSSASAKLDLPEPLRPTTSVRPGPGSKVTLVLAPIPRNPRTSSSRRYTPDPERAPSRRDSDELPSRTDGVAPASTAAMAFAPSHAP